jgi:hypothetical protein
MNVLANTILAGAFPFLVTMYLSPLVLLVETLVLRSRHRKTMTWGKVSLAVLLANLFSFLLCGIFCRETIRGFEDIKHVYIPFVATFWAFTMSVASEYLIVRCWLGTMTWRTSFGTCLLMNVASYALIIVPALWYWVF